MAEQDISRRGFLGWATGLLAGLGALFVAVPLVGTVVASVQPKGRAGFVSVGDVSALKPGEPVAFPFVDDVRDAYVQERVPRMVWAVKRQDGSVTAYSPVCPHLGCEFFWDPTARQFVCPCHDSRWDVNGRILGGPTPRAMDTLVSKVENGALMVRWEQFQTGTPEKIPVG
ncbi:MAG TPA: ubiquinol-cytochrome c reductase iron-sulfur subunit [Coriobacteriia bacterium]|jgi:Rieske Fe-S protein